MRNLFPWVYSRVKDGKLQCVLNVKDLFYFLRVSIYWVHRFTTCENTSLECDFGLGDSFNQSQYNVCCNNIGKYYRGARFAHLHWHSLVYLAISKKICGIADKFICSEIKHAYLVTSTFIFSLRPAYRIAYDFQHFLSVAARRWF